jgi:hypothetical protein
VNRVYGENRKDGGSLRKGGWRLGNSKIQREREREIER